MLLLVFISCDTYHLFELQMSCQVVVVLLTQNDSSKVEILHHLQHHQGISHHELSPLMLVYVKQPPLGRAATEIQQTLAHPICKKNYSDSLIRIISLILNRYHPKKI